MGVFVSMSCRVDDLPASLIVHLPISAQAPALDLCYCVFSHTHTTCLQSASAQLMGPQFTAHALSHSVQKYNGSRLTVTSGSLTPSMEQQQQCNNKLFDLVL